MTAVRKQITFDLDQKKLQKYYPKKDSTSNEQYYKKSYKDISDFMKANDFSHRQYSVYISNNTMTKTDIVKLTIAMVQEMPWLSECIKEMDVTDISNQHSLVGILKSDFSELTKEKNYVMKKTEDKVMSLNSFKKEIQKRRENNQNTSFSKKNGKNLKNTQKHNKER